MPAFKIVITVEVEADLDAKSIPQAQDLAWRKREELLMSRKASVTKVEIKQ